MKRVSAGLGLVSLVRTVRAKDIHKKAERAFRLGLIGSKEDTQTLATVLAGTWAPELEKQGVLVRMQSPVRAEAYRSLTLAVFAPRTTAEEEEALALTTTPQVPVPTLVLERPGVLPAPEPVGTVRRDPFLKRVPVAGLQDPRGIGALAQMVAIAPEYRLTMGRRLPALRSHITRQIILETSRANAEVAALSNLPDLIPVIGNFIGTSAEFVVLTKTQIAMVYSLAALYGRDIRRRSKVILEIMPVVGSAFVWRTVAREVASMLPFFLGAVPKILIAYTGTFVLGQSAAYYYNEGRKPPKAIVQAYYNAALERAKSMRPTPLGLKGGAEEILQAAPAEA